MIEDAATLNAMIVIQIARLEHEVRDAGSPSAALIEFASFLPVALLDIDLPDTDGLEFLSELREYCPVVVVTALGSIDQAVRTVRAGAANYLVKPVTPQNLTLTLHRFFETLELRRVLACWRFRGHVTTPPRLVGDSPAIVRLRGMIVLIAKALTPVMILGEPGTGKETAARIIHS